MTTWEFYALGIPSNTFVLLKSNFLTERRNYFTFLVWTALKTFYIFQKQQINKVLKEFEIEKVLMDNIDVFCCICNSRFSRIPSNDHSMDSGVLNCPLDHIALYVHLLVMAIFRRTPDPTLRSRSKSPNKSRSPFKVTKRR